jgi:hypothetical protein
LSKINIKTKFIPRDLPHSGCFGFVNGHLLIGHHHHQAIMAQLIDAGWTWEDLMTAEQIWGWFVVDDNFFGQPHVNIDFVSDAATMNKSAAKGCRKAFTKLYKIKGKGSWKANRGDVTSRHNLSYGGDFDTHYGEGRSVPKVIYDATPIPEPPRNQ